MVEEFRSEVPGSARVDPPQVILHFVCNSYTLFIFYKNKVYKNAEAEICQNLKNILGVQIPNSCS